MKDLGLKSSKMITVYMAQETRQRGTASKNGAEEIDFESHQPSTSPKGEQTLLRISGNSTTTPRKVDMFAICQVLEMSINILRR